MTPMSNPLLTTLPNVLHDQTIPNTLGGLRVAAPVARFRAPTAAIVVVLAISSAAALLMAVVAILMGRPA